MRFFSWALLILANPFAYLPECVTWACGEHLAQALGRTATGRWRQVIELMLLLCVEMREHVIGFNETVGNSLDHLHLVSHRPLTGQGLYPLQQVAARLTAGERAGVAHIGLANGYPIDVWRIAFADIVKTVAVGEEILARWQSIGGDSASANCTAIIEDGVPVLYLVPRSKLLKPWGWSSMPACVETHGLFIGAHEWEVSRVRHGAWGYNHFSQVLASLRPPGVGRLYLPPEF